MLCQTAAGTAGAAGVQLQAAAGERTALHEELAGVGEDLEAARADEATREDELEALRGEVRSCGCSDRS